MTGERNTHRLGGLIIFLFIISLWWALSESGLIGKTLIASPSEVANVVKASIAQDARLSEKFYLHTFETVGRSMKAWLIAILISVPAGTFIGSITRLQNLTETVTEFIRAIPPVLAFPLLLVAFNFGEAAYTGTIIFGCVPVLLLTVAKGAARASADMQDVLTVFQVSRPVKFFLRAMEIIPSVFLGARLTLTIAVTVAVVAEMVFTPRNGLAIGSLARDAQIDFNTPMFYTCVISIGLFGYLANRLLRALEQRLFPMRHDG